MLYEHNGIITLGVKAPAHIDVDRKEIFLKKQTIAEAEIQQHHQAA
mgnify:FL=1